jgi:hypothetical protein
MANNDTSQKKIWSTRLTDNSATDKEGIGARRVEGAKEYKYIKYNQGVGAIAAVAGNMVAYKSNAAFSDTQAEVTSDVSDGITLAAGKLMSAIPNGWFGWVQTEGVATLTTALVSGANGQALQLSTTTDGTLKVGAAATDHVCAYAIDAAAKIVYLQCPS